MVGCWLQGVMGVILLRLGWGRGNFVGWIWTGVIIRSCVTFCSGGVGLLIPGGHKGFISLNHRRKASFLNLPKVLKARVQVEVAHSRLRTASMLVTCLPLDASPEKTNTNGLNSLLSMTNKRVNFKCMWRETRGKTYRRGSRSLLS